MTGIIILVVVVLLVLWFISIYNNLVRLRNNRENAFANIDVQLKQRYDLVPQLVSTVKGYASHEKEVFMRVTEARSAISDIENKLAAARRFFNSATRELNNGVQTFPGNIISGMFGFHKETMYEIAEQDRASMDKAPEIKF